MVAWDSAATLVKTREECISNKASDAAITSAIEKMEKNLAGQNQSRVVNQYGLNTSDRKYVYRCIFALIICVFTFRDRLKSSWYWDLIDNGRKPSPNWTIWNEVVIAEVKDLKSDQDDGITDEEESTTLNRIRKFEEVIARNEEIDRSLYDCFGKLIDK